MKKFFITLFGLLAVTACATTVIFPLQLMTGNKHNRTILIQPDISTNQLVNGTNLVGLLPVVVTPTNGVGRASLLPWSYTVRVDGWPKSFHILVPDSTNTLNAVNLITNAVAIGTPVQYLTSGFTGTVTNDITLQIITTNLVFGTNSTYTNLLGLWLTNSPVFDGLYYPTNGDSRMSSIYGATYIYYRPGTTAWVFQENYVGHSYAWVVGTNIFMAWGGDETHSPDYRRSESSNVAYSQIGYPVNPNSASWVSPLGYSSPPDISPVFYYVTTNTETFTTVTTFTNGLCLTNGQSGTVESPFLKTTGGDGSGLTNIPTSALVREVRWVDALAAGISVAASPTEAPHLISLPGASFADGLAFDHGDIGSFTIQALHVAASTNTDFPQFYYEPHIHPSSAVFVAGQTNTTWIIEWQVARVFANFTNTTSHIATNTVGFTGLNEHQILSFGLYTNNALQGASSIIFRGAVQRIASASNDVGNAENVILDSVDFHIPTRAVGFGSTSLYSGE